MDRVNHQELDLRDLGSVCSIYAPRTRLTDAQIILVTKRTKSGSYVRPDPDLTDGWLAADDSPAEEKRLYRPRAICQFEQRIVILTCFLPIDIPT